MGGHSSWMGLLTARRQKREAAAVPGPAEPAQFWRPGGASLESPKRPAALTSPVSPRW